MAGPGEAEDRTEAATPRRLQQARAEGQVPISRELPAFAGLAGATLVLALAAPGFAKDAAVQLSGLLASLHGLDTPHDLEGAGWLGLRAAVELAAPFVLAALVGGVAAVLLQSGLLLNLSALRPDFSRLNPATGFGRLFGADNLIEAGKSLLKIAVMGAALWRVLASAKDQLLTAPFWEPSLLLDRTVREIVRVLMVVLAAQGAIAALDIVWVRLRHTRALRMSRDDIRQEQKETEGDPHIKARLKRLRLQRGRKRMLAAVPKATVVLTNPTHYAVALAYDRDRNAAPRVVAKGVDELAARIRELAQENRVPLVANPPLARALYRVEVDAEIPAEHYQAVAEIIAYVWRLGQRARGGAR